MQIELSEDEVAFLRELLQYARAELREEVYKTEAAEWKRALKSREQVLARLLGKLATT